MNGLARAGAAALVALPLLVACGGSPSLADPGPCPTPVALTPTPAARRNQGNPYFTLLQDGLNQLQDLYTRFRLAHPSNRFGSDSGFRPAVARFVDDSTCLAKAMRDVEAPNPALQASKQQVDAALDAYIVHLKTGRDAVRTRNVTDYHTFWDGLEAQFDGVRAAFSRR